MSLVPHDRYAHVALYAVGAALVMALVLIGVLCVMHVAFQNQRARRKVAELEADRLRRRLESLERIQSIRNSTVTRMLYETMRRVA